MVGAGESVGEGWVAGYAPRGTAVEAVLNGDGGIGVAIGAIGVGGTAGVCLVLA